MNKPLLLAFAVCCMGQARAQQIGNSDTLLVGFEVDSLPHSQMDYTQTIDTGNYSFDALNTYPNQPNYKEFYGRKNADSSFNGFTYSNIIDTIGIDSLERRAAFPGNRHNGSTQYAVAHGMTCHAYFGSPVLQKPLRFASPTIIYSLYVTNTTYDVLSMLHGDSTSKKFGGTAGTDPDWFLLTIKGYNEGQLMNYTLFYLADFRSDTPSQDYIVKDWRKIDLDNWQVDSLSFSLSSSDTDSAGRMVRRLIFV